MNVPGEVFVFSHPHHTIFVRGLRCGADDYIYLPCGREETQARLRPHACRFCEIGGSARWSPLWESEDRQICLQVRQHQVVVRGQALRLSATECVLLFLLASDALR